jgi:hypothetical protein
MTDTPESFAYRCLPLNIANAHGWEVLNPHAFDARWTGEAGVDGVQVRQEPGAPPERAPVSLFGQGVLTFHVEGIFRTPPGWNLWVGGSPNRGKDGVYPLTGVVETDWSPFTFTMNWRFTRPNQWVRFEAMEPFCFVFPVQRGVLEAFVPKFEPLAADPATMERFKNWSSARDEFHRRMTHSRPRTPANRWQKHYYRGVDVSGRSLVADHQAKLRLHDFNRRAAPEAPAAPPDDTGLPPARGEPPGGDAEEVAALRLALAKREWLLESLERQRALAGPAAIAIERRACLSADDFLEQYYALGRPVILTGEMADCPALERWTPAYLKARIGSAVVEFQGDRMSDPDFESRKEAHRREGPFDAFIDRIIQPTAGNDLYLTAYNSKRNERALAPLAADLSSLDKFLDPAADGARGMLWIGPAGTLTSLHHDLTNNFIAQIVGRKRLKLLPASEVGKLYNAHHVFSQARDLEANLDLGRFPRLASARVYDVLLEPGEILFVPFGWWHQVRALDFSVTITHTNFRWPNDAYASYPMV